MTVAFLSLGSNIEPEKNILEAVKLLSRYVKILNTSTVYLTEPLGRISQPKFYNCVLKVDTDMKPHELKFKVLRVIEEELGRKRTRDKCAPRTIDIDIILYGNLHLKTKELTIPAPDIEERAFLAIPLREFEPELRLSPTNMPIKEVADKFKQNKMFKLKGFTETLQSLVRSLSQQNP